MIRYAIVSRGMAAGDESERRPHLVREAVRLAESGVDFLQVREKDLSCTQAAELAGEALSHIRSAGYSTQVLLNAEWTERDHWPADVGLHLSVSSLVLLAQQFPSSGGLQLPAVVSASCHTLDELRLAKRFATMLLFAPVFEKRVDGRLAKEGRGLESLAEICRAASPLPVLAMGGVTLDNAAQCLAAGASGIAGIRLFQEES